LGVTWTEEQSVKTTNELSDDRASPKTMKHVWQSIKGHFDKWMNNQNPIVSITLWFKRPNKQNIFKLCELKKKY
jgi:hypothetical protein